MNVWRALCLAAALACLYWAYQFQQQAVGLGFAPDNWTTVALVGMMVGAAILPSDGLVPVAIGLLTGGYLAAFGPAVAQIWLSTNTLAWDTSLIVTSAPWLNSAQYFAGLAALGVFLLNLGLPKPKESRHAEP
jgi:hypothetical protein